MCSASRAKTIEFQLSLWQVMLNVCSPWASLGLLSFLIRRRLIWALTHQRSANEKLVTQEENLVVLNDGWKLFSGLGEVGYMTALGCLGACYKYMHVRLSSCDIRDLNQWQRQWQQECHKIKGVMSRTIATCTHAIRFVHFLTILCKTTTWND